MLIHPQCLECLSHGANFKKMFKLSKGAQCLGLTIHIIFMPDFLVIDTSYIIINVNCFFLGGL